MSCFFYFLFNLNLPLADPLTATGKLANNWFTLWSNSLPSIFFKAGCSAAAHPPEQKHTQSGVSPLWDCMKKTIWKCVSKESLRTLFCKMCLKAVEGLSCSQDLIIKIQSKKAL